MGTLLIILLLAPFGTRAQGQVSTPAGPAVEVLDLEVVMHVLKPHGLPGRPAPAPPMPGPVSVDDLPGRGGGAGRSGQPTIRERSIGLNKVGTRAPRNPPVNVSSPTSRYEYRLRVKNAGAKRIRSILWEYQIRDPSNTSTVSRRLFLCAARVKPGGAKMLRAWSPPDPINVASADASAAEAQKQRAVVNRVEYTDGSTWQREGWEPAGSKRADPAGAGGQLREGQCTAW